jgi:predicted nucleic acid-binding protein
MRVLLDTNMALDVLLQREPWLADARRLWQVADEDRLEARLPASTLTDIFYVARRLADLSRVRQAVQVCLDAFEIAPVDRLVLERAQVLSGVDFGDNVQIACAELNDLEAIVTRNADNYEGSTVAIWSPRECVERLTAKN